MIEPSRREMKILSANQEKLVSLVSVGNEDLFEATNVHVASSVLCNLERNSARLVAFALDLRKFFEQIVTIFIVNFGERYPDGVVKLGGGG